MPGIGEMTASDVAAWWGAILATGAVLFDFYKWRKAGPQITLSAMPDMETNGRPEFSGKVLTLIQACNTGDRASTITRVGFEYYPTTWRRLRRRPILSHIRCSDIPHKIEPGAVWQWFAFQSDELTRQISAGKLYCAIQCSTEKRPILTQVRRLQE